MRFSFSISFLIDTNKVPHRHYQMVEENPIYKKNHMIFEGIQTMQKFICDKIYSWVQEGKVVKMPREGMNGWIDEWMDVNLSLISS